MQRSSLNSTPIKNHNLKDTLKDTIGETCILPDRKKVKRSCLGNTLNIPFTSGSCNYLDGLERVQDRVHDTTCPQLIITSPTSDNVNSYECDNSEKVNKLASLDTWPAKGCKFCFPRHSFQFPRLRFFNIWFFKVLKWNHIIH